MTRNCTLSSPHKSLTTSKGPGNAVQSNRCEKSNVQNVGTRRNTTNFLKSPPIFPECIRNNVNWMSKESGLTDLENQMEQTEFAAGHLINIKIAIDSLLLNENSQMKEWKLKMKQKCRMYYTTMLSPSVFLPVSLR